MSIREFRDSGRETPTIFPSVSCFASARTSSAGLGCVRNLRSSSSICMVFVCTCPVPFRMLSTVASQKPFH